MKKHVDRGLIARTYFGRNRSQFIARANCRSGKNFCSRVFSSFNFAPSNDSLRLAATQKTSPLLPSLCSDSSRFFCACCWKADKFFYDFPLHKFAAGLIHATPWSGGRRGGKNFSTKPHQVPSFLSSPTRLLRKHPRLCHFFPALSFANIFMVNEK